nr:F0F1 ATP synthase subunit B [uncultured Agathobaculum sp.]
MAVTQVVYQAFVSINWWSIFVTLCNTLITFGIVKKLLFQPVRRMIEARKTEVQAMYDEADRAQIEAGKLERTYNQKLAKAQEEAAGIIHAAARRAEAQRARMLEEATQQAAMMMQQAERDIEIERKKARRALKGEVADLSVLIAGKVIEREVSSADHERLIHAFIDKAG